MAHLFAPHFFSLHIISATVNRNNALSMILSAGSCSLLWPQFCLAAGYWINGNAVGAVQLWELWKPVTAAGLMENTTSSPRSRARWIQTARPRLLWSAGDSTRRGRDNGKGPCVEEQRGVKVKWRCSEREGQDYWLIGLSVFYPSLFCSQKQRRSRLTEVISSIANYCIFYCSALRIMIRTMVKYSFRYCGEF